VARHQPAAQSKRNHAGLMGHVHIYVPPVIETLAQAGTCPDCGKRTRFLIFTYEWYGPDATCILCGRSFNEEGWTALPFIRGSRQKEIARARERFRTTVAIGFEEMLRRANEP